MNRDFPELQKALDKAVERYQSAQLRLQKAQNEAELPLVAQEANEAWLEFKRVDNEVRNFSTMKKLGDLFYGS